MRTNAHTFLSRLGLVVVMTGALLNMSSASAKDSLPEKTPDGLLLRHDTKHSALYTAPGASLKAYDSVYLVDVYVAFAKDWQRDYNRDHFDERVTESDLNRIKERIAKDFKEEFTKVLTEGGYAVTQDLTQNVMILRPAIINLQITAPDVGATNSRTFVSEAGSMTLYMELYDAVTNAKFAEVYDAVAVGDRSFTYIANRATNRSELDRTLRSWAETLVKHLDEAHQAIGKN